MKKVKIIGLVVCCMLLNLSFYLTEVNANYLIQDWDWVNPVSELRWNTTMQHYELTVRKAYTEDEIKKELPVAVSVHTSEKEEQISIEWSDIEKADNQDKIVQAKLKEGYELSESARPLEVHLVYPSAANSAEDTGVSQTVESRALNDHVIQGISPAGTKINLFDYWLFDNESQRFDPDNRALYGGFNLLNQPLKFCYGGSYTSNMNTSRGDSNANQGILNKTLSYTGYPTFNADYDNGNERPDEKLLFSFELYAQFDPTYDTVGKKSFPDAKNLLQIDEDGYYYYDSRKNFAEFNEANNSFTLYDSPGVVSNSYGGQFFPFNNASDIFAEVNGKLVNGSKISGTEPQENSIIHHYMGLTMETSFSQLDGGTNKGKDVVYSFSGDDDTWVFIDGVLVGDVGGMHAPTDLEINFRTGKVKIFGNIGTTFLKETTIAQTFKDAGRYNADTFNGDTFADNTEHTLKFFYLERGNAASNLRLKYNLVQTPGNTIKKLDGNGTPIENVRYSLYPADASYQPSSTPVFTGVSDEGGLIYINESETNPYTLKDLRSKSQYYVLKEEAVPDGYRKGGDIHLKFAGSLNSPYWIVENPWEANAIALLKQTIAVSVTDTSTQNYIKNGASIVAFVTKKGKNTKPDIIYQKDDGSWVNTGGSGNSEMNTAYNSKPYILHMNGAGVYEASIPFPADYVNHPDDYAVSIYLRYNNGVFGSSSGLSFDKNVVFTSEIEATNIQNAFTVEKLDDAGKPLSNAVFSLYTQDSVEIQNGKVSIPLDAVPYDTAQTDTDGKAVFGLQGTSNAKAALKQDQAYYLYETKAPAGYVKQEDVVAIQVEATGISANANTENDGIIVKTGLGKLSDSMLQQYARDNGINSTLHEVKAVLQTKDSIDGTWESSSRMHHFLFADSDYAVIEPDKPYFETDAGWSGLKVLQCKEHDTASSNANKQDLKDQNLANIFQGDTRIQITNRRETSLRIKKQVKYTSAYDNEEFSFRVNLYDRHTAETSQSYTAKKSDGSTQNIKSGSILKLKPEETITISGLSNDGFYKIEEILEEPAFTTTYAINGGNEIERKYTDIEALADKQTQVVFTNAYLEYGDINIRKVNADRVPLANAGFALYELLCSDTSHHHDNEILLLTKNGELPAGYPYAACWKKVAKVTTDITGNVYFTKVPVIAKEYRLIEYKAPDGYLISNGQWRFQYDKNKKQFVCIGSIGRPTALESVSDEEYAYYLYNYQPHELPLTGNRGIAYFMSIGMGFMVIGGGVAIRKKKKL